MLMRVLVARFCMQYDGKYKICKKGFVVNVIFVEYISTTIGTCISGIANMLYYVYNEFVLLDGIT